MWISLVFKAAIKGGTNMDYTKDSKLMQMLTELSHEVQGLNYSLGRTSDQKILAGREKNVNELVEKVQEHLTRGGCHE